MAWLDDIARKLSPKKRAQNIQPSTAEPPLAESLPEYAPEVPSVELTEADAMSQPAETGDGAGSDFDLQLTSPFPPVSADAEPDADVQSPTPFPATAELTDAYVIGATEQLTAPFEPVTAHDEVEQVEIFAEQEAAAPESEFVEVPAEPGPVMLPSEPVRRGIFGPKKPKTPKSAPNEAAASAKTPRERRRIDIFGGFKDPVRRPRYVLWAGVIVLAFAAFMIAALGITSTRWFCAEGCHKVQDDTITAYQHSSHSEVSCMACHMPVGSNPVVFILHKAEALGELYLTLSNNYELPLNGESEVARTMPATQCTQCHDESKRKVTPSAGVIINHETHANKGIQCTLCHNRVAHNENFKPTLTDPKTKKLNQKHEVYSSMTACFRCHTQGKQVVGSNTSAPGRCSLCHSKDFKLKPPSHLQPGFFPAGHAQLAQAAAAKSENAKKLEEERSVKAGSKGFVEEAAASESNESPGERLPTVASVNECSTCHSEKFCSDCHGVPMPHPATFKKTHGTVGKENPQACVKCHGAKDRFCDDCHHSKSLNYTVDKTKPWIDQHFIAAGKTGTSACFDCHKPTYCARCHVRGGKL